MSQAWMTLVRKTQTMGTVYSSPLPSTLTSTTKQSRQNGSGGNKMRRVNAVLNMLLGRKKRYFYYLYMNFICLHMKVTFLGESSLSFDVGRRLFWLKHKWHLKYSEADLTQAISDVSYLLSALCGALTSDRI